MKSPSWVDKQYRTYTLLSLATIAFAATLYFSGSSGYFQPYFGPLDPLLVILLISLLGAALCCLLFSEAWFAVYRAGNRRGLKLAAGGAFLFGILIILLDLLVVFPEAINVPAPAALLFYPAIGFVVEVLFHLLPLALLLRGLSALGWRVGEEPPGWGVLALIALLEPTFQAALTPSSAIPGWAAGYVWIHIFSINLIQLLLLRRYDFVTMYTFRLVYYSIWHIVWGHLRLSLLF